MKIRLALLAIIVCCCGYANAQLSCTGQPMNRTTASASSVATTVSVTAGDLILVHFAWANAGLTPSISDGDGNVYNAILAAVLSNGTSVNMQEYYALAKSTNSSLTITASTSGTSARSSVFISRCSGAVNWAFEAPSTATGTSANPAAGITVSHNAVVLWAAYGSTTSGAASVGTGYTKADSNFSGCLAYFCSEFQVVNSAAIAGSPWSGSFTLASSTWAASQVAFYDGGGSSGSAGVRSPWVIQP